VSEDEEDRYEIKTGGQRDRQIIAPQNDPFARKGDELKKVAGLSDTTRRRQSRILQKAYTGADGAASKKNEVKDTVDAYNLFGVVLPAYNMDYLAKIYEMSAPHYAAVKAKVANIAGLGFDFVESHATRRKLGEAKSEASKKRIRKQVSAIKEELYSWLDATNDEDTFSETLIKVWTDYEVTGNGYLEIGRKLSGEVGYIGHIPASSMRVRKVRDGYVQMIGDKAHFFRNFGDTETPDRVGNDPRPNEVIHIKKYSPTNGFYGVPDIIAAQQAIVGNEFAARFNLDYFENKAVPRYVIVIKGSNLSSASEANLLSFFETGLKGQNHRTLFVPLPADDADKKTSFEMKPVEAGTQDSSFVNYRRGNLSDILMAHRVPVSKVSMAENVSLAASRDADKNFKEQVCRPEQKMLEKKLAKVISEVTDVFNLKLNELSLTDEDTQSKIHERYLRFGALVPNEIRRDWGKEPLPDGDKSYVETSQEKAETTATAGATRTRDAARSANGTDSNGEGRNEQGAGRASS